MLRLPASNGTIRSEIIRRKCVLYPLHLYAMLGWSTFYLMAFKSLISHTLVWLMV